MRQATTRFNALHPAAVIACAAMMIPTADAAAPAEPVSTTLPSVITSAPPSASPGPTATPRPGASRSGTAAGTSGGTPCAAVVPVVPQAAAGVSAVIPWAQRRYLPERLRGLADGHGVVVAVVDSGVDAHHPQLAGQVLRGVDLLDGTDGRIDCVGHGTAVASIIVGTGVAGTPFRGLAAGARILPVRVSERAGDDGSGTGRSVSPAELGAAIRAAVDRGASVINLSLVLYRDEPAVRTAVGYAVGRDVVLVAAAGNRHGQGDPVPYPAAYPGVVGVTAVAADGRRVDSAQIGSYVDIAAPGDAVLAARPPAGWGRYAGTSFAAPFVAATAALVRQYHPELPAPAVIRRITGTADPGPGNSRNGYGAGILNPYRAVVDTVVAPAVADRASQAAPLPPHRVRDPDAPVGPSVRVSLVIAATGVPAAAATLLLSAAWRRGSRRRWRPAGITGR